MKKTSTNHPTMRGNAQKSNTPTRTVTPTKMSVPKKQLTNAVKVQQQKSTSATSTAAASRKAFSSSKQNTLSTPASSSSSSSYSPHYMNLLPSHPLLKRIPAISYSSITPDEFHQKYVLTRTPVILRSGGMEEVEEEKESEFSALSHTWTKPSYITSLAGDARVRIEWKSESNDPQAKPSSFGRAQHEWMKMKEFVEKIQKKDVADRSYYLTSQPIPSLTDGTNAPSDLCAEPITSLLGNMPLRPQLMKHLTPIQYNCWIGGYRNQAAAAASSSSVSSSSSSSPPSFFTQATSPFHRSPGSTSGLHHDYHDNLYLLLKGHKYFHLYPPSMTESMYAYGMKPKEASGDDGDDGDAEEEVKQPECIIHENGVIEYILNDDDEEDENGGDDGDDDGEAQDEKQRKLLKQMMEEDGDDDGDVDEEDEEMENEEDDAEEDEAEEEEDEEENTEESKEEVAQMEDNDSSLLSSTSAAASALYTSKHLAITSQLAELRALASKVSFSLKYEVNEKRKKHLTQESGGLQKKVRVLEERLKKVEEEEKKRVEEEEKRVKEKVEKKDVEDDEEDDDEEIDPENMQDDYEESGDDENNQDAEDDEDGEDNDNDDNDDEDAPIDEDDEDDEDIDPAEKAAWMAFMKQTATGGSKKKDNKKSTAKATAETKAKNTKVKGVKRKGVDDDEEGEEEEQEQKQQHATKKSKLNNGTAAASSTNATSDSTTATSSFSTSSSTPSSSTSFPPNFSRLDFTTLTPKQITSQFPLYVKNNCRPFVVELKEGEMLYLPASWWHEVFSCGVESGKEKDKIDHDRFASNIHFALNYWFHPPPASSSTASQQESKEQLRQYQQYYEPRVKEMKKKAEGKMRELEARMKAPSQKATQKQQKQQPMKPQATKQQSSVSAKKQSPTASKQNTTKKLAVSRK